MVKSDEVRLEEGKISWLTIALKVTSYILLFLITLTLLVIYVSLGSQHEFIVMETKPARKQEKGERQKSELKQKKKPKVRGKID